MLKRFLRKKEIQISPSVVDVEPSVVIEKKSGILQFETLNFKLAILQILMYDLNVLDSQFDLYEFVDEYTQRPIYLQEEGYDLIPEVLEYFENYEIDSDFAQYVSDIYMDPMHDIYTHIFPFWDGMDDIFDIKHISTQELSQFPNLKTANFMGYVSHDSLPVLALNHEKVLSTI